MTSLSKSRKWNRRKITSQGLGVGIWVCFVLVFILIGYFEYLDSLKADQKPAKDGTLIASARNLFGHFPFALSRSKEQG